MARVTHLVLVDGLPVRSRVEDDADRWDDPWVGGRCDEQLHSTPTWYGAPPPPRPPRPADEEVLWDLLCVEVGGQEALLALTDEPLPEEDVDRSGLWRAPWSSPTTWTCRCPAERTARLGSPRRGRSRCAGPAGAATRRPGSSCSPRCTRPRRPGRGRRPRRAGSGSSGPAATPARCGRRRARPAARRRGRAARPAGCRRRGRHRRRARGGPRRAPGASPPGSRRAGGRWPGGSPWRRRYGPGPGGAALGSGGEAGLGRGLPSSYAIPIVRPYGRAQAAVARLRERIARAGEPQPAHGATALSPVLVADELAKLARLRDDGVLTPDEFAHQKRRLLGL